MSNAINNIRIIFNGLIKYIGIVLPLFLVINYNFYPFNPIYTRVFTLSAIIILIISRYPLTIKGKSFPVLRYLDTILIFSAIIMAIYSYFELNKFIRYLGIGTPLYQIIVGTLLSLVVLESTRRIAGPVLPLMAIILTGYALNRGYNYSRIITEIFSYNGIFGFAYALAISVVFMFLLFGNLLNGANFGNFLLKFGNAVVGGMSGGPAKVAVLSSSIFGTLSGSAVANVVGTGTFTIPMMKKLGFSPTISGAIEASASTGGLIMPPVMAAAAFLIAEILQMSYIDVAKAALMPALAYYVCVYTSVDAYAKRKGIRGIPRNERPSLKESFKEGGHLLLALGILIYFLVIRIDPLRAAFLTMILLFPISFFSKKTRLNFKRTFDSLIAASNGLLVVASCTATVGSIIALISVTGLGGRIALFIVGFGGENVMLVMFLVMIVCILFGMALPATASYLVLISIVGYTLTRLGVVPISAHLFVLYFAALSGITPPVALAAYAGASIADAPLFTTAINSVKFSITAFIIPFMFVATPAIVLAGDNPSLLYIIIIYVLILPITISWGVWGYTFFKRTLFLERIFYLVIAIAIVYSSLTQRYFGITISIIGLIGTILFHSLHKIPFLKELAINKKGVS